MSKRRARTQRARLRDHVDLLVDGWADERPDLDTSAVTVVYRLTRIAAAWSAEIDRVFARHGITSTDFAVLANLRRTGAPFRLHQRQLMAALRLTSGTMSLRVDKMVERGLVTRTADPKDARASLVTLTDLGQQVFDEVAPEHLANEARLLAALPSERRAELADLLRTILVDIEQPETDRPDTRLGLTVGPATTTQRKRAEVGLRPQHGLLVESVRTDGPAARAGVRAGDLLTVAGATPLHALTCLERALEEATNVMRVQAVRNERPITFDLTID